MRKFGIFNLASAQSNKHHSNRDWADDEDLEDSNELPQSTTTTNKDGTQTIVTWRFNDDGKKVKTTRRIRFTKVKEIVNPRVAERKSWGKFGLSQKDAAGVSLKVFQSRGEC